MALVFWSAMWKVFQQLTHCALIEIKPARYMSALETQAKRAASSSLLDRD
jgi:hypothetical protein